MRKIFYAALALALTCSSAIAQLTTVGAGWKAPGGGGSYVGPGDIVGVGGTGAFWGLRAYSAATASAGALAIQLCTASDALCTDIHVTSTGGLNASDLTASGCSSINTCTIKIFYDGSGNGKTESQATIANRATFQNSCIGSLPCAQGLATTKYSGPTFSTGGLPSFTLYCAANRTTNVTVESDCLAQTSTFVVLGSLNSANTGFFYTGAALSATASDNTWHNLIGVPSATTQVLYVDATATNGGATASVLATAPFGVMSNSASNGYQGNWVEGAVYMGTQFNSTQAGNLNSNVHSYWGF